LRAIGIQTSGNRGTQLTDIGAGTPGTLPVVEHHRQYRRQGAFGRKLPCLDQVLVEQSQVGEHPQRHERIRRGLEFQQQIDIKPAFAVCPFHPPDQIVFSRAQVIGDVAAIHGFQAGQIQVLDPRLLNVATQQVHDHVGMTEQ